jgi:hypothetical protein
MAVAVRRVPRKHNAHEVRGPQLTLRPKLDLFAVCEHYADELDRQNARNGTDLRPYLALNIRVISLLQDIQGTHDTTYLAYRQLFDYGVYRSGQMRLPASVHDFMEMYVSIPMRFAYSLRLTLQNRPDGALFPNPEIIAEYDVEYHGRTAAVQFACTQR